MIPARVEPVGEPEVTAEISLPISPRSSDRSNDQGNARIGTATTAMDTRVPVVTPDSAINPTPPTPVPEPMTDIRGQTAPPASESEPPTRESPPPSVADMPTRGPAPPTAPLPATPMPATSLPATPLPATRSLTAKLLSAQPPALPDSAVTPATATAAPAANMVPFSSLGIRRFSEPRYPRIALARQVAGAVHVAFVVDRSGKPQDPRVVSSEPDDIFDEAALDAVKRWRFDPPRVNGIRQPVHTEIRLVFKPAE
ncbi:MAG: TonB family protein [Gammaproteobacteria bacterium]